MAHGLRQRRPSPWISRPAAAGPQGELAFDPPPPAIPEVDERAARVQARLLDVDPDGLTPRAALSLVYELRQLYRD